MHQVDIYSRLCRPSWPAATPPGNWTDFSDSALARPLSGRRPAVAMMRPRRPKAACDQYRCPRASSSAARWRRAAWCSPASRTPAASATDRCRRPPERRTHAS